MTGREKAVNEIKRRKKEAEEKRIRIIDDLRKDGYFDKLYREINALKWDYIKTPQTQKRAETEEKISAKENEINKYIKEKGVPYDIFEMPVLCNKCNDGGTVNGKICECVEKIRKEIMLNENPMLRNYPTGFDKTDFSYYGKNEKEKRTCAEYIEKSLKSGKKIFIFAGKTGTGKTYFAGTFIRALIESGKDARAISAIKLNKELLEYHCAPLERKKELWETITEADAILIDDLGAEQVLNNVTIPYILEMLTERTENKVTVITTNLSPVELEKRYGQRIVSRLLDKKLSVGIEFGGEDLRISKK